MLSLQNNTALPSQQTQNLPTSTADSSAAAKISRAQRRKAAFANKKNNTNNTSSSSVYENSQSSLDDNHSLSSSPSIEIPSLHEPFSSVASYGELIAKRIRTLKKLWTKIQKYEEIVEIGGGKAALNKDQIDALNRKPEVFWSLRELEDLHKQATTFENEEAVRIRRIKQEADRAHAIAIAQVREEERKAADARVRDAVKSVHALLGLMPSMDALSDQEVGVLEAFKRFMFDEVLAQQNAIEHAIPSIFSNLESGAEVPIGDYDMTYAHIKPLIDKILYPAIPDISPSSDAATEERASETELLVAASVADQCAEARAEAADALLSDASALHNAAADLRDVAEALHNMHVADDNAAGDVYMEQPIGDVPSESVDMAEEQDMGETGYMGKSEIRFGSVEVDTAPVDMFTEESREISTSHTVVTSMVGEAGHHQVIVDDECVTTVTSTSHTVTITDVNDAQLNSDVAPQVTPSATDAFEAEQASRPANQAQRPRSNNQQNRNRYYRPRHYNNGNNSGNINGNGNQNRQRSPPQQHKPQYQNISQQHQQQPPHEQSNEGGDWQTHGSRNTRPNRPQQNQYRNGPGGARGGFRGRGRGGMRGGHQGGNGQPHQTQPGFQAPHNHGYRGGYRRPYNANNNGPAPAPTNAVPVAQ